MATHPLGTWYIAPAEDPTDEWSAGYAANVFDSEEEAESFIESLRSCGPDFAATEWVAVQRETGR